MNGQCKLPHSQKTRHWGDFPVWWEKHSFSSSKNHILILSLDFMQKCQVKGIPPWPRNIAVCKAKLLPASHYPFEVAQNHAVLLFSVFFPHKTIHFNPPFMLQPFLWNKQLSFHITQMFNLQSQPWSLSHGALYSNLCAVLSKADITLISLEHSAFLMSSYGIGIYQKMKCLHSHFLEFNFT